MKNPELHSGEPHEPSLTPPETPIYDNLQPAEDSFGTKDFHALFEDSYSRFLHNETEVWFVMGRPISGKTFLTSELMTKVQFGLKNKGISDDEIDSILHYVAFEDAQKVINGFGYPRDDDEDSEATQLHYLGSNILLQKTIAGAILPRQFIIVEAPGMIGRGDPVLENLMTHKSDFEELDYTPTALLINTDEPARKKGMRIRSDHPLYIPDNTDDMGDTLLYDLHNIQVHLDEDSPQTIPAGGFIPLRRYYRREFELIKNLIRSGVVNEKFADMRLIQLMRHPELRVEYLEQCYAPWYFGKKLGVPEDRVFVGRNSHNSQLHLYQETLNERNIFTSRIEYLENIREPMDLFGEITD